MIDILYSLCDLVLVIKANRFEPMTVQLILIEFGLIFSENLPNIYSEVRWNFNL